MDVERTASADVPATSEHPLRNAVYRRWFIGSSISLLGDQFYLIALPWLVLEKLGSAAMLGALMMAGAIPRAALLLVGGVVTDRVSARWIMVTTATTRALCVAVTGILVARGELRAAEMYLLVIVFGIADAFAMPAQSAYLPSILRSEQLVAGSGLGQSVAQFTGILGPMLAGLVIARLGVALAFYIDAVSFLFVIAALLRLPDPPRSPSHTSAMKAIGDGIAYVMRDVPLRAMVLLAMVVNLCVTGPLAVGIADIAKVQLGSSSTYGTLVSAIAAGGLAGAMLASVWRIERRGILILCGNAVLGACLAWIGAAPANIYLLSGILALIGCIAGFVNIHIGAWVMQRIDVAVRGRVSSVLILISLGATPLSMGLAGFAVARSASGMFLAAGLALLCVTIVAAKDPSIRRIA
jgi:MFS family permease